MLKKIKRGVIIRKVRTVMMNKVTQPNIIMEDIREIMIEHLMQKILNKMITKIIKIS